MKHAAILASVVLGLLACGSSDDSWERKRVAAQQALIDEYRASVEQRLAALDTAAKAAQQSPPMESAAYPQLPVPAILPTASKPGNVAVFSIADALDRKAGDGMASPPVRASRDYQAMTARSALTQPAKASGPAPETLEMAFTTVAGWRYALLVRIRKFLPPKAVTHEGDQRFVPGQAFGDARLYDLETGTELGGFPFDILQGRTATVTLGTGATADQALVGAYQDHFIATLATHLRELVEGNALSDQGMAPALARMRMDIHSALATNTKAVKAWLRAVELDPQASPVTVTLVVGDAAPILGTDGKVDAEIVAVVHGFTGAGAVVRHREERAP